MIDLVAGEDDQPPDHAPWSPAQAERDSERRSFIPAELSLDRPHIVQSRLDLDDKQAPARRIERENGAKLIAVKYPPTSLDEMPFFLRRLTPIEARLRRFPRQLRRTEPRERPNI